MKILHLHLQLGLPLCVIHFTILQNCGSGNTLVPEKTGKPQIHDIYQKPVSVNISPEKFQDNVITVSSETNPGQKISMSPDPAIHEAKRTKEDILISPPSEPDKSSTIGTNKKTLQKRKPPVIYTGNELLRSKEKLSSVETLQTITIIRGQAVVRHEEMVMRSQEIMVEGEDGDFAKSDYPVTITDRKTNTLLKAGYGEFRADENRAYFNKKPVVVHIEDKTNVKTTMVADEMDRYFKDSITRAIGHVIVYYPDATAYGSKGTYFEAEEKIVLEGNPRVYEKKNVYLADKMTVYRVKKYIVLEGNVRIFVTQDQNQEQLLKPKQQEKSGDDQREVVTIITGDYGEYRYGESVKIAEMQTKRNNSFVYVSRKDSDTYCRHLVARGEGLDEVEFFENVFILDKKNRTRVYGEYANYSKSDKRAKVFTRSNISGITVKPVLFFYNKHDVVTGRLVADLLDRDIEKETSYGRGDAEFQLYEKQDSIDTPPRILNTANGEWAEMDDKIKIIYMLGRPYLLNGDNKIYAARIAIYPDDNRLELHNSLEGVFSR